MNKTPARKRRAAKPDGVPRATPPRATEAHTHSRAERLAAGKSRRDQVSREAHATWRQPSDRFDPIALLQTSDAERIPQLVPIRYGRMLASPFAFYRGSAAIMAADLAGGPATGLRVQACGDCHLMNFGGFATPERNVLFDINDFDETLPGPWEWDVKRLAASFVLAARSLGFKDAVGQEAAATSAQSYRKRIRGFAKMDPLEVWYTQVTADDVLASIPAKRRAPLKARIEKALSGPGSELDFPKLAAVVGGRMGIRDLSPLIFHPPRESAAAFLEEIDTAFADYRLSLTEERRVLLDRYRAVDAAIKVVGVGSVGRRCWIVLMMSADNAPLFLQFKEAVASVLEPFAGASAHPHHGERVVVGQRLMQPASDIFLGCMTGREGRHFYGRQLRDAKIKPLVESFDEDTLLIYAQLCGWSLARAHARSAEVAEIAGYLGASDQFDEAIGRFALAYADQAERDHGALKAAVRRGAVAVVSES